MKSSTRIRKILILRNNDWQIKLKFLLPYALHVAGMITLETLSPWLAIPTISIAATIFWLHLLRRVIQLVGSSFAAIAAEQQHGHGWVELNPEKVGWDAERKV